MATATQFAAPSLHTINGNFATKKSVRQQVVLSSHGNSIGRYDVGHAKLNHILFSSSTKWTGARVSLSSPLTRTKPTSNRSAASAASSVGPEVEVAGADKKGPVIVWFKQDLRVDDHPGLVHAAARAVRSAAGSQEDKDGGVVAVWCLDRSCLPCIPPDMLRAAVVALRSSLKELGSTLVVRLGSPEDVIPGLAKELKAAAVVTEEEVEHRWMEKTSAVEASLEDMNVPVLYWNSPMWESTLGPETDARPQTYAAKFAPDNFREFKKTRGEAVPPMDAPLLVPSSPTLASLEEGDIPPQDFLDDQGRLVWVSGSIADSDIVEGGVGDPQGWRAGKVEVELDLTEILEGRTLMDIVGGGCKEALRVFDGYLRYLEARGSSEWEWLDYTVRLFEKRPDTSFTRLFSPHLAAGVLSRRRVYQVAMQYEKERNGGNLLPFSWFGAFTAEEATKSVDGSEFQRLLAKSDADRVSEVVYLDTQEKAGITGKYWMWRGALVQYLHMGPQEEEKKDAPAILLVHGFGAMSEHFRRNVAELSREYNVYVPTNIGFGRSEKPLMDYTQNLWTEMLRDFTLEVVQAPVAVVGNSIGGIFAAKLAADNNNLVSGVVMLNPAGAVNPEYVPPEVTPPRPVPIRAAVVVSCALLFAYLERDIKRILQRCYVHEPEQADDWLAEEIFRAACDPNAISVFQSSFYLPKPQPLNFYLDSFDGPALLLQGKDDPLNDAVGRANGLDDAVKNLKVELITAGHCPHDEIPKVVNEHISDWMNREVIEKIAAEKASVAALS